MLGSAGFSKWLLQARSIVDMGGSLEQAKNVYNYFSGHCFAHESIYQNLPSEPTMNRTQSDIGNYFKAVAASQKQIRGPHPDVLFVDEACETKDELILSALPMINTSANSLVVMTSTFHKIFGLFQEYWDKADVMNYCRLSWDIFDVTFTFSQDVFKNEDLIRAIPDFTIAQAGERSLEWRAKGRTGDDEGWIPIGNIIQAWREKDTLDWFDVEYMGSRPSASGMVNDPEDVDACVTEDADLTTYEEGAEVVGGLDWGWASMTSWVALMSRENGVKAKIANRNYTQVDDDVIIKDIVEDVVKYGIRFIYADSAGKFSNSALQKALNERLAPLNRRCSVVERVFSKDKPNMLGNYRSYFQRRKMLIPKHMSIAIWQHKRYRFQKDTDKPVKKDDHVPDATMCALWHWPLGRSAPAFSKPTPVERAARADNRIIDARVEQADRRTQADDSTIFGGLLDE